MARNQALALVLLMILQTVSVTVGDSDNKGNMVTNSHPDAHQHDANLQQLESSPWFDPELLEGHLLREWKLQGDCNHQFTSES